jgi:NDP-sugar pyrophosphorylase family protein
MTGVGQRFIDAGFRTLKPLIATEVGTMIQNVLNGFPSIDTPICIINKDASGKELLIQELKRIRPKVRIVEIPPHKKGPSFAIWQAREHIDSSLPVIVSYCDFSGFWSEKEFFEQIFLSDGLIQTYTGFHPHMIRGNRFAYVKKDVEGNVIGIQEKSPYTNDPMSEEASSGIYGFRTGELLIEAIRKQIENNISLNGEFYTSLTYKSLLEQKLKIKTIQMEKFFQWGTPEDLRDFNFWARLSRNELPSSIPANESSAIILAAGSGSRIAELAQVEKPFVSVFGNPLWFYTAAIFQDCREKIVFSNEQNELKFALNDPFGFRCVLRERVTKSQSESALLALKNVVNPSKPVHIAACDNVFLANNFEKLQELLDKADLVVWVTHDYAGASLKKNQYSWVSIGPTGEVTDLFVKANNPEVGAAMLVGNFSFGSASIALELIERTIDEKMSSSAEVYLDWVTETAVNKGYRVFTFDVHDFWAIGTADEFRTLQYWRSVFRKSAEIK